MTPVGLASARQLLYHQELSSKTFYRMVSYLVGHKVDNRGEEL